MSRIHTEDHITRKPLKARMQERLGRHVHHTVRWEWDMDVPSWPQDPKALEFCDCGASRHMWHGGDWRGGTSA